jgi:hypothetical protein
MHRGSFSQEEGRGGKGEDHKVRDLVGAQALSGKRNSSPWIQYTTSIGDCVVFLSVSWIVTLPRKIHPLTLRQMHRPPGVSRSTRWSPPLTPLLLRHLLIILDLVKPFRWLWESVRVERVSVFTLFSLNQTQDSLNKLDFLWWFFVMTPDESPVTHLLHNRPSLLQYPPRLAALPERDVTVCEDNACHCLFRLSGDRSCPVLGINYTGDSWWWGMESFLSHWCKR